MKWPHPPDDARGISLSAEIVRLSQLLSRKVSLATRRCLSLSSFLSILSIHVYVYMYVCISRVDSISIARVIPLFFTFSLSLHLPPYRASLALLFSFTGTLSPFGPGRHPSSEATKSRHLLRSSSRGITTAVAPFNIDEGVTADGSGTRCRVWNIHSHGPALNFTLFVMIRILFFCPRSIFGSTLIPQISSSEMDIRDTM